MPGISERPAKSYTMSWAEGLGASPLVAIAVIRWSSITTVAFFLGALRPSIRLARRKKVRPMVDGPHFSGVRHCFQHLSKLIRQPPSKCQRPLGREVRGMAQDPAPSVATAGFGAARAIAKD